MANTIERGKIASSDGTSLAYMRVGKGPPLAICHGSFTTAADWLPFAHAMSATHSVYLYDRRGRGESVPATANFALDAEVDDLASVLAHAGPGTSLLGHSFGGGCALSLTAQGGFSGKLIVYEPRHSVLGPMSRGQIPEIERRIAAGDPDAALAFVLEHVIGLPAPAIAAFRQSPQWPPMLETLSALPAELRFLDTLAWGAGDLDRIPGAPHLLAGEGSPPAPDVALQGVFPRLRRRLIAGQKHFAYVETPALLADIVRDCLAD